MGNIKKAKGNHVVFYLKVAVYLWGLDVCLTSIYSETPSTEMLPNEELDAES